MCRAGGNAQGWWLLFPWEPGQQGRAGCPPARQVWLCCRHRQLECRGGGLSSHEPRASRSSRDGGCFAHSPWPPRVGTVLGDSAPGH